MKHQSVNQIIVEDINRVADNVPDIKIICDYVLHVAVLEIIVELMR